MRKVDKIKGNPNEFVKRFYNLARKKVKLLNSEDYSNFENKTFGDTNGKTASYHLSYEGVEEGNIMKMKISNFEIMLNEDAFFINGKNYSDLIPYIIEHEIFETYLSVKPGYRPSTLEKKHLLARRKQYVLAMQEGKAEKLFEFHKNINLNLENELKYAYDKAKLNKN